MDRRTLLAAVSVLVLAPVSPAFAGDFHLEKRLPLAAGGTFSLRSEASGIQLRGQEGATEAVVTIDSNRADFEKKFSIRFETPSPDRVDVVIENRERGPWSWFSGGFNARTEVVVSVPAGVSAELASSGGGIEVNGIGGSLRARSSGGGIHVTDVGGAATLSSSGGAVQAERVGGDVDASSSGGGVTIREAGGAVEADSSGGGVRVTFAAGNGRGGILGSSGGGVEARVDPGVALDIDASSSGGAVDCDLPVTVRGKLDRDSVRGTLNGGGAVLKLRSSGGGVTIAER